MPEMQHTVDTNQLVQDSHIRILIYAIVAALLTLIILGLGWPAWWRDTMIVAAFGVGALVTTATVETKPWVQEAAASGLMNRFVGLRQGDDARKSLQSVDGRPPVHGRAGRDRGGAGAGPVCDAVQGERAVGRDRAARRHSLALHFAHDGTVAITVPILRVTQALEAPRPSSSPGRQRAGRAATCCQADISDSSCRGRRQSRTSCSPPCGAGRTMS